MIAFTSQLAHVVSNAYIKSPTAVRHKGFSAGSYKDVTRVAWLNPDMWAELCMENSDHLLQELEGDESLAAVTGQPINLEQEARQLAGWNLTNIVDYLLTINAVLSKFWCRKIRVKGKYCDCLSGSLLMVKAEIMLTYGMYDERFFLYGEENVLGWKLRQAGFRS